MKKTEVTCDQCGNDLTSTGNCEDYRIVLANESIPSRGGFVTAMAKYRPLEGTAHFCGTLCLAKWVSTAYPNAATEYDKRADRRALAAGTRSAETGGTLAPSAGCQSGGEQPQRPNAG